MRTDLSAIHARCPLCGTALLSVAGGGRVVARGQHPVLLGTDPGRGYALCEVCGFLAQLPRSLTLN
jgi:hypothetical protein